MWLTIVVYRRWRGIISNWADDFKLRGNARVAIEARFSDHILKQTRVYGQSEHFWRTERFGRYSVYAGLVIGEAFGPIHPGSTPVEW